MKKEVSVFLAWRTRMNLSQRHAAKLLGVALTTYQSWEKERSHRGIDLKPPQTALLAAAAIENDIEQIS